MTSSYSSRCFRISKLRPSTWVWARSMDLVTIFDSMGTSSSIPSRSIILRTPSEAKIRMRSSSKERKNRVAPGSP